MISYSTLTILYFAQCYLYMRWKTDNTTSGRKSTVWLA